MLQVREVIQPLWRQVRLSIGLFHHRTPRLAALGALIVAMLAVALAPEATPSGWDWTRILLILLATIVALACFLASREAAAPATVQQQRLFAAAFLVTTALLIAATFGLGAAIASSFALTVTAILAASDRQAQAPWLRAGAMAAIIPVWIWTLLDAWHPGLLLLVPLGVLALVSDAHMRDTTSRESGMMSPRAHRFASWLGILASALIVLVAGLTDLDGAGSPRWLLAGAIGAILCLALDAGLPGSIRIPIAMRSVVLCDAALGWIAFCWLASL